MYSQCCPILLSNYYFICPSRDWPSPNTLTPPQIVCQSTCSKMKSGVLLATTTLALCATIFGKLLQCGLHDITGRHFRKIKSCHRSNLTIMSSAIVKSVSECMKTAGQKGGLAINFSPPERKIGKHILVNCQVMSCPESVNSTTLLEDIAYDYYSHYGDLNGNSQTFKVSSNSML